MYQWSTSTKPLENTALLSSTYVLLLKDTFFVLVKLLLKIEPYERAAKILKKIGFLEERHSGLKMQKYYNKNCALKWLPD